jgi:hypothetical protein
MRFIVVPIIVRDRQVNEEFSSCPVLIGKAIGVGYRWKDTLCVDNPASFNGARNFIDLVICQCLDYLNCPSLHGIVIGAQSR